MYVCEYVHMTEDTHDGQMHRIPPEAGNADNVSCLK